MHFSCRILHPFKDPGNRVMKVRCLVIREIASVRSVQVRVLPLQLGAVEDTPIGRILLFNPHKTLFI